MWFGGSFDIRDLGNIIVILLFDDENDPKCIHMRGPWSFVKYMVGSFHPREAAIVEDTRFDIASFWVQIHGLQIRCLTGRMLRPLEALWAKLNTLRNRLNVIVMDVVCESRSI